MKNVPNSIRRAAIAGVAVIVLGGAAVGIAAAQAQPATPASQQTAYQKFIASLAQKLGVSQQTLESDVTQARQDAGLPAGPGFPGEGRGGPRGFGGGLDLDAVATAIGITPQQLHTELAGKTLTEVAQAHGKNPTDVANALKTAAHNRIDQAVTNGRLTADQAASMKTNADQRIDQLMTQTLPAAGPGFPGNGRGPGGFGFARGAIKQGLDAAAQAIGITPQELRTELPGKSLAQVAQAHGKNASDVATALKNEAHTRIDQAVTNGRLTADQAASMKTNADQRIDQLVNQVMPTRPPGADTDTTGA